MTHARRTTAVLWASVTALSLAGVALTTITGALPVPGLVPVSA